MKINTIYLFYAFILINTFFKGIGLDNSSKIYLIGLIIGVIALIEKLLNDKYTKKEIIFIASSLLVGIITFLIAKTPTLLLTCLCLAGMKNVEVNDVFKKMYYVRLLTFVAVITLSLAGIIENEKISMWRSGRISERYSLGFGHPNTLHLTFFILVALYMYNKYEKLKILDYSIIIVLNLTLYQFSVSRTGMIVTMLLVVFFLISKIKGVNKIIIKLPIIIFIILLIFSFATGLLYGKVRIMDKLNDILNGRVAYSHYYLQTYGFSLFGSNTKNDTNALFDNGYLYMYVQFGIIGLAYLSILYLKIFKKIMKTLDVKKAVLSICFLIYIFTESFSPNIFMNIILLFAADTIFIKKSNSNYSQKEGELNGKSKLNCTSI